RFPLKTGFLIEAVEPGSPADAQLHGGDLEITIDGNEFLLGGDIITMLNGATLDTPEHGLAALKDLKVGDEANMTIFRDGKKLDGKYRLSERPLLPGDLAGQSAAEPLMSKRSAGQGSRLKF